MSQHHSHRQRRDADQRFLKQITARQEQELLRLATVGHSIRKIAADVGISKSSVATILAGDSFEYQALVLDFARFRPQTPQELSERLDLPVEFVQATLARNNIPAEPNPTT